MNMIDWYLKVVRDNYANFSGRARRSEYWYFTLCNILIGIVFKIVDYFIGLEIGVIESLYDLVVLVPSLAVFVRRLHDVGKSGWFMLWTAIPMAIGLIWIAISLTTTFSGDSFGGVSSVISVVLILISAIWILVLTCTDGDVGANEYGLDPKRPYEDIDTIGAEETETY